MFPNGSDLYDSPQLGVEVALRDLGAAIDRFARGQADLDEGRRGLNEALHYLYVTEQALYALVGKPYWDDSGRNDVGRLTQALTYLRGISTHRLIDPTERFELAPGEGVFPSVELFPGQQLFWLEWEELAPWLKPHNERHDKREWVRIHLAGRRILPSLRAGEKYLVEYVATARRSRPD